jgi:hypothetical protein
MQRISSGLTFYYKRAFPVMCFGAILVALIQMPSQSGSERLISFLVVGIVLPIVGYAFIGRVYFKLADEVLDAGDALIVRKGGREERVLLADIIGVNYPQQLLTNLKPPVTLRLRTPSRFGDQITFMAPEAIGGPSSPVIEELIRRIDAAQEASNAR